MVAWAGTARLLKDKTLNRIGDTRLLNDSNVTNIISPMISFFPLTIAFVQKYDKTRASIIILLYQHFRNNFPILAV